MLWHTMHGLQRAEIWASSHKLMYQTSSPCMRLLISEWSSYEMWPAIAGSATAGAKLMCSQPGCAVCCVAYGLHLIHQCTGCDFVAPEELTSTAFCVVAVALLYSGVLVQSGFSCQVSAAALGPGGKPAPALCVGCLCAAALQGSSPSKFSCHHASSSSSEDEP